MITRTLPLPDGYDPATQTHVGLWAAGLDDQSRRILEEVADLDAAALSWQPGPGHNSIGSLLAHIAMVEVAWICFVSKGMGRTPETGAGITEILGVADGRAFLVAPEGGHPDTIAGWTLERYHDLLARARAAVHETLRTWTDASLSDAVTIDEKTWTRAWILYHVLEHEAAHFGQVGRLLHDLRDAGVIATE